MHLSIRCVSMAIPLFSGTDDPDMRGSTSFLVETQAMDDVKSGEGIMKLKNLIKFRKW